MVRQFYFSFLIEMDGLDLDLSDQDEVESSAKEDYDIEKELIADYKDSAKDKSTKVSIFHIEKSKKKNKALKKVEEVEVDEDEELDEELDEQTQSKKNKIMKILDCAKSGKEFTNSLATKLLSLFRTAILLSNDNDKDKDSKKVKSNDEKISVGKDKEVDIIISSNPLLYK